MRIPPLKINIVLESDPLKSRNSVRSLAVDICGVFKAELLKFASAGQLGSTARGGSEDGGGGGEIRQAESSD